jgi:hypothetical protein
MGNGINLNTHDWEGIAGNPEGYPKLDGRSVRCVKEPPLCAEPYCEARLFPADVTRTVDVPTIDGGTLKFLTYNLGACPELSAKQQMAYQSPFANTWSSATPGIPCISQDAKVYGGLFQWGRIDYSHAGRCPYGPSSSPEYYLGSSLDNLYVNEADYLAAIAADTAKIASAGGVVWIDDDYSDFWGNGEGPRGQGVTNYSGQQDRYNPCPTGFRLPTQQEWASIGFSDGNISDVAGDIWTWCDYNPSTDTWTPRDPANPGFPTDGYNLWDNVYQGHQISAGGTATNNQLVWISVVDGKPSFDWDIPGMMYSGVYGQVDAPHMCGYALYTAADWAAATGSGGYLNGVNWGSTSIRLYDDAAPEPLMFLSAAGLRAGSTGAVCNTGYTGSYWSSTLSDNNSSRAYAMQLYGTAQIVGGYPLCASFAIESNYSNWNDANCISSGRSVRCVAETPCAAPIIASTMEFCRNYGTPTVSDLIPAPSTAIKWYNASDNTLLNNSDLLTDGGQYYCIFSDGSCTSPRSNTMTVDLIDEVSTDITISGPTVIHQGDTVTYTYPVSGDVGTVHYEWYLYRISGSGSGLSVVSGQGTNSLTVAVAADATNAHDWNITVEVRSQCSYYGAYKNISVVCPSPPAAPTVTDDIACSTGTTQVTLYATAPTGCTAYWYSTPTAALGSEVNIGSSYSFNLSSTNTSKTLYVESRASDGCISATRTPVTAARASGVPVQPSAISSSVGANPINDHSTDVEFWVTNVSSVTNYTWEAVEYALDSETGSYTTVPTSWFTITSGAGTYRIRTTIDTQGITGVVSPAHDVYLKIRVTPSNGCGTGTARERIFKVVYAF